METGTLPAVTNAIEDSVRQSWLTDSSEILHCCTLYWEKLENGIQVLDVLLGLEGYGLEVAKSNLK